MEKEGEFYMYKKIFIVLMIAFMVNLLIPMEENKDYELERKGNNLIRFHVLANSDSTEDQQLKLKVRDKIVVAMGEALENSSSIEETRDVLRENLFKIEEVAREEISYSGKDYKVSAVLTEDIFPTKRYGNIVLPAGEYEALKIIIGAGGGQNWWCVMFPPLCFVDIKNGLIDEKTQQELKTTLTEEEYNLVYISSNTAELPLQLKSKIVEIFKTSKNQLGRLASKF